MKVDLLGRVGNIRIPYSKALLPLFEAVVNSFQSLEDLNNSKDAFIRIYVNRGSQSSLKLTDDKHNYPVVGFVVEDNGVGFDQANFHSFETSDSVFKKAKGGKGIGRLLWLKAFESVDVSSVYNDQGKSFKRQFKFSLAANGVSNHELLEVVNGERLTRISLNSFHSRFQDVCPKKLETIAQRIIEHCLTYFLAKYCPRVLLSDETDTLELNQMFAQLVQANSRTDNFRIKTFDFTLTHLRLYSSEDNTHKIHLCANNREVESKNLSTFIPNLLKKIKDDEERAFIYLAYLSGNYLDMSVNPERTGFTFIHENEIDFPDIVMRDELDHAAIEKIKLYLKDYLEPINKEKIDRITKYIQSENPQYRPLLKHKPQSLEKIAPDLSSEKLDVELYKVAQELDLEVKQKSVEFLKGDIGKVVDLRDFKTQYHAFIEQVNDIGKSNLARYIVHRKLILDLLSNTLNLNEDNKYKREDSIHEIIFPMRSTSDDITYENQNLWVIDERLAYHHYLTSDIPFNQMDVISSDSLKRPDVMIFNNPMAFVDEDKPYNSVVILEFKRPGRISYDEENENPITQVYNYVREIVNQKELDRQGRPILTGPNSRFYAYIICDLTPKLIAYAQNVDLTPTPDAMGYFGYNKNLQTYIEVLSYEKILLDAKKRNRVLFDKLFVSGVNNPIAQYDNQKEGAR